MRVDKLDANPEKVRGITASATTQYVKHMTLNWQLNKRAKSFYGVAPWSIGLPTTGDGMLEALNKLERFKYRFGLDMIEYDRDITTR
eukprot:1133195-Pyramimonas_sp.AAC.1